MLIRHHGNLDIAPKALGFELNDHPLRNWTMKLAAARQISTDCS